MNTIDISIDPGETGLPDPTNLAGFTHRVLEQLFIENWELSVLFCGNERMQQLNRQFRGLDESTDVLSFPQYDDPQTDASSHTGEDGVYYAGDIVISCDYAQKNAQEFSVNLEEELKRLIVHGVLHLCGLDHSDNDSDQPMLQRQEALLTRLARERLF
jgi:probable rRNA maturation factor